MGRQLPNKIKIMKKLRATKKITLATLKSFAKRNKENLFSKEESSFSGMSDMVEQLPGAKFSKVEIKEPGNYWKLGIEGIYLVGSSRDYFTLYEDAIYIGIEVYNSCGNSILVTKKS